MDVRNTITNLCEFHDESSIDKYVQEYKTFMETGGKRGLSLKKIELEMFRSKEYISQLDEIQHSGGNIINVFLLCRDNQDNIRTTMNTLFQTECENPLYEFHYWIFENDSKDKTRSILHSMMKNKKGMICTGDLNKEKWGTVKNINRVRDMARYRMLNRFMCEFKGVPHMSTEDLSGMYDEWLGMPTGLDGSDYCMIVDTGVGFDSSVFSKMKNQLEENSTIGMICPFGYVKGKPDKYYDTYALCQTKNKINSAFGGICVVRSKLFKVCNWNVYLPKCSEHNMFCYDIIKHGYTIKIDRSIKVEWAA